MQIRPLGNQVLVESLLQEEISSSGIILTDSASQNKKAQGKIISIGSGRGVENLGLKVGEVIIFEKWVGEDVEGKEKKELKIIPCEKILAVIE